MGDDSPPAPGAPTSGVLNVSYQDEYAGGSSSRRRRPGCATTTGAPHPKAAWQQAVGTPTSLNASLNASLTSFPSARVHKSPSSPKVATPSTSVECEEEEVMRGNLLLLPLRQLRTTLGGLRQGAIRRSPAPCAPAPIVEVAEVKADSSSDGSDKADKAAKDKKRFIRLPWKRANRNDVAPSSK